jgi:hypothetical protein
VAIEGLPAVTVTVSLTVTVTGTAQSSPPLEPAGTSGLPLPFAGASGLPSPLAGTDPVGVGLTVMNLVEVVVDLIVEVLSAPAGEPADFSPALGVTTG